MEKTELAALLKEALINEGGAAYMHRDADPSDFVIDGAVDLEIVAQYLIDRLSIERKPG